MSKFNSPLTLEEAIAKIKSELADVEDRLCQGSGWPEEDGRNEGKESALTWVLNLLDRVK